MAVAVEGGEQRLQQLAALNISMMRTGSV
eukprot:COSAG01_NODE_71542_length_255_cov_1.320513_1_plen_28_part_10